MAESKGKKLKKAVYPARPTDRRVGGRATGKQLSILGQSLLLWGDV